MFEFTLKIDPAVAELLGLDGDSIIEAFYDPDEDEIVIRVLDEDELDGEFNDLKHQRDADGADQQTDQKQSDPAKIFLKHGLPPSAGRALDMR